MADLPKLEALKLLARLANVKLHDHLLSGRGFFSDAGLQEWNPYTNAHQLNGLIEQEKVSVGYLNHYEAWVAHKFGSHVANDKSRTKAAVQCLAQIAKERFGA